MSEKKNFPNVASMQDPGSQRTGYATGGRVKKAGGGKARVKKYSAGKIGPKNLKVPSQRGRPRTRIAPPPPAPDVGDFDQKQHAWGRGGGSTGGKVAKAKGGRVTKATGGRVKKQRGGEPQFRTDPSGRRGQAAYYGHVGPKAAAKSLRKKPPGRAATQGIGMKKGGRVSKAKGGKAKK
jgi:hypothetical protein